MANENTLARSLDWHRAHDHILIRLKADRTPSQKWRDVSICDWVKISAHARKEKAALGWKLGPDDLVIDVDPRNGGDASLAKLREHPEIASAFDTTRVIRTGGGGMHLYLRKPADLQVRGLPQADFPGIDVKRDPGYVVIAGSWHAKAGAWYRIERDVEPIDAPPALLQLLTESAERSAEERQPSASFSNFDVAIALARIDPERLQRDEWVRCLFAVKFELGDEGFELADAWSARDSARYGQQRPFEEDWGSIRCATVNPVTGAYLEWLAREQRGDGDKQDVKLGDGDLDGPAHQEPASDERPAPMMMWLEDLHAKKITPPTFLLPWLVRNFMLMVHARAGIGKTWFSYALVRSLLTGEEFLGYEVIERLSRVLIIDGEMAENELQQRTRQILPLLPKQIAVLSTFWFGERTGHSFNMFHPQHQALITKAVERNQFELVVMDNRSSLSPGQPENSDENVERATGWMTALRNQGVSTLLVHHSGKSGNQRGSSKWEDPMNVIVKLEEVRVNKRVVPNRFQLSFDKTRNGRPEEDVVTASIFQLGDEAVRVMRDQAIEHELDDDQLQLLKLVRDGRKTREIASTLKITERSVRNRCHDLVPLFLAKTDEASGGRGHFAFTITTAGLKALDDLAPREEL